MIGLVLIELANLHPFCQADQAQGYAAHVPGARQGCARVCVQLTWPICPPDRRGAVLPCSSAGRD